MSQAFPFPYHVYQASQSLTESNNLPLNPFCNPSYPFQPTRQPIVSPEPLNFLQKNPEARRAGGRISLVSIKELSFFGEVNEQHGIFHHACLMR